MFFVYKSLLLSFLSRKLMKSTKVHFPKFQLDEYGEKTCPMLFYSLKGVVSKSFFYSFNLYNDNFVIVYFSSTVDDAMGGMLGITTQ